MAQQINLFNPSFRKQKDHFSAVTMLQALALLFGGVMGFYGYAMYETRALARAAVETGRLWKAQSEQLGQFTRDFSPQGRSRQLEEDLARLNSQFKQRQEMLAVLSTGGLGNTEGFSRYLTAFAHRTLAGVWLTGFTIGGDESELVLNGRALHPDLIPAFIRALNREEVMRGRRVSELRLTAREERDTAGAAAPAKAPAAPGRYVEFSLTATRGITAGTTAGPAEVKPRVPGAGEKGPAARGAK